MRFVEPKKIKNQLNKCYVKYDPDWLTVGGHREKMKNFDSYLEETAGLKIDYEYKSDNLGRMGYELHTIEVLNESKFTMWLLKWT